MTHMSERNICINFDAPNNIYLHHINPWKNAAIWCNFKIHIWQSRFWGHWGQRMFNVEFWGCGFEILQSFLNVWQTSLWQTVPKFWFICLFYCSSKTYSCKLCKEKDIKVKQIRTLEPFVIQKSALPFWGWQPNFQKWLLLHTKIFLLSLVAMQLVEFRVSNKQHMEQTSRLGYFAIYLPII